MEINWFDFNNACVKMYADSEAFMQYNRKKSSFTSLNFFSIEIACFDFNDYHSRIYMYKCMRACACMHGCITFSSMCMRAYMCVLFV